MNVHRHYGVMELKTLPEEELRWLAEYVGVEGSPDTMGRREFLYAIMEAQARYEGGVFQVGRLKIDPFGHGVVDTGSSERPAIVGRFLVKRHGLASGDLVAGLVRKSEEPGRPPVLLRVEAVNGKDPDPAKRN